MRVSQLSFAATILATALAVPGADAAFIGETSTGSGLGVLANGTYAEVGDAGGVSNPQDVVGTGIGRITGTIGPDFTVVIIDSVTASASEPATNGFDVEDAFRFYFDGGDIGFIGLLDAPVNPTGSQPDAGLEPANGNIFQIPLPLDLFVPPNPVTPLVPSFANGPHNEIRFQNLPAGNYILQAYFNAFDPPFSITLFGPTTASSPTVSAPRSVPEPATLALLALGVVALAARRRALA